MKTKKIGQFTVLLILLLVAVSGCSDIKQQVKELEKQLSELKIQKGNQGEKGEKGDKGSPADTLYQDFSNYRVLAVKYSNYDNNASGYANVEAYFLENIEFTNQLITEQGSKVPFITLQSEESFMDAFEFYANATVSQIFVPIEGGKFQGLFPPKKKPFTFLSQRGAAAGNKIIINQEEFNLPKAVDFDTANGYIIYFYLEGASFWSAKYSHFFLD